MTLSEVVSQEEWLVARRRFLAKEREHMDAAEALHAQRRALPRFLVDKDYKFETEDGRKLRLVDLFEGRQQLIIFHFMQPATTGGVPCFGCSFWIDSMPHHLAHLHARDTTLVVDWPQPLAEILPHKERMGWTVPIVSSYGSGFYDDISLPLDSDEPQTPGISAYIREDDKVYCTYAARERGSEPVNSTYNYLDLTALGRQEEGLDFQWEWLRYHDEYDS